ncbi:type II toxin-antitoxin system VapC family toxin [Limnobacter sp.]|uniref:type II toxin-antitoxin system VapC family toxin n=1 Tax=Limnobacter sp. TaxID=2003368 RepID=UPI0027364E2E|nr:type II toxin-antitoxin system VapC family toxin [Limnobacter sp.]MDP3187506.1 type II toxin-antitoxin system VapC family toxin [Limnobacter sp.]
MYLLDTNVVSELRKAKPHGAVLAWLQDIPEHQLYLSAFTLAEIQSGIEKTREQDQHKAEEIERWLNRLELTFSVLPMDSNCFRLWAKLMHRETDTALEDAMIAATAMANKLTVVTRNSKDFRRFDVPQVNPFEYGKR